MQFTADLHLHGKYSRAVSPSMTIPVMAEFGRQKGLDLLSVADWTHPLWFKEIREQLEEKGEGIYKLKDSILTEAMAGKQNSKSKRDVLFLLSTEISSIFKQGDRVRRIHNLVFVPSFEVAEKVINELNRRGCNLKSDGRPIVGLSSKNLLELVLGIDARILLIPCHVWTPHFGLYGSASGFNSIEESFGELSKYIYGVETGLSSDPEMNWRIKELENRSILSFSDAHSPAKMGREATVFKIKDQRSKIKDTDRKFKISYEDIRRGIMRDPDGRLEIGYTVEFYPEEGRYHFSGHRNCKVSAGPERIKRDGNICPKCRRRFTEGVFSRIQQLSDGELMERAETEIDSGVKWFKDERGFSPPYVKLVPLLEIAAEALYSTVASQKSKNLFADLCNKLGSEMNVLLKASIEDIEKAGGERVAEGVAKVRKGDIVIHPGYDGEYGKVRIWGLPEGRSLRAGSGGVSMRGAKKIMKNISKGQLELDI